MPRATKKAAALHLSGDERADSLISRNPFALVVGMVLDQQFPLERAFASPALLAERLGAEGDGLDAALVAATDPAQLEAAFRGPPALHRFPASMGRRVQELARIVVDSYGGDTASIWESAPSGAQLFERLVALPGFGERKARIFLALLGKQLGVTPPGWREASAPFGEPGSRLSVADIDSAETLALVREHKKQMKATARAASGR